MKKYSIKKNLRIAIDGPVAAGKGTIASIIAQNLGLLYINTGAMYRAVAYLVKVKKIDLKDEKKILEFLKKEKISLKPQENSLIKCQVFLGDDDITEKLFTQEISWGASLVATLPGIREELVKRQREIALKRAVIIEGRDTTTRVLPEADFKIFLTADPLERAKRRKKQLERKGIKTSLKKILEETLKRDYQDTHRLKDPLRVVPEAFYLDTTNMKISEVVKIILKEMEKRRLIKRL